MKLKFYYVVAYGDDGSDLSSFVWATSKKQAWKLWRKEYQREPERGATLYRVKHVKPTYKAPSVLRFGRDVVCRGEYSA